MIIVDSVANLVPKKELEADMGAQLPGLQARMMAQALRKLTAIAARSKTTIIFINQIRYKIGVMFGSPETTPGGNALKFYCSMRIDIRRTGSITTAGEKTGNTTKVKIVKNKVAPPFKQCEFTIVFGEGIDRIGELIDLAVSHDIIKKSGSWYSYEALRLGQGPANVKDFLETMPEVLEEIKAKVTVALFPAIEGVIEFEENVEEDQA